MTVILADSTVNITRAEATALGAIVVPMTYSVKDGMMYTESYIDECGAYEKLIAQKIAAMGTSQVTLGSFMSAFDDLRRAGHDVLCLTISSRLSGTYANARMAAREYPGEHIEVVDTLTTGGAMFFLLREARACLDKGMSLKDVAARLRARRNAVKTIFTVDDMTALRRSGRLGNVKMSVSTILNIKPVLKCENGVVVSFGTTRGRDEQIRALKAAVTGHAGVVLVQSFLADAQAKILLDEIRAMGIEVEFRKVGPVLAVHLGCGTLGVAWMET